MSQINLQHETITETNCIILFVSDLPVSVTARSDVTESMVTTRSPFCGYNTIYKCVELNGEDLSCYSNKIDWVSLRKCPCDRWLTIRAYLSDITATDISRSFSTRCRRKPASMDMELNYAIVILCIDTQTIGLTVQFQMASAKIHLRD